MRNSGLIQNYVVGVPMSSPLTITITERVAVSADGPSEAETVSNFAKSLFNADENSIETQLTAFTQ